MWEEEMIWDYSVRHALLQGEEASLGGGKATDLVQFQLRQGGKRGDTEASFQVSTKFWANFADYSDNDDCGKPAARAGVAGRPKDLPSFNTDTRRALTKVHPAV